MPFKVQKEEGFFLVYLWGNATKWEVIQAVGEIRRLNWFKELPDVWVLEEDVVIPFSDYDTIIRQALSSFPAKMKGAPSAIVVRDAFQVEMARLYIQELSRMPYPVRVFTSMDEALVWVKDPQTEAV